MPAGQRLVFCSGQLGIAADGTIPARLRRRRRELCFANIAAILARGRPGRSSTSCASTPMSSGREHLRPYMDVRNGLFSAPLPASTLMIVSGFARPEFMVEIEAIAAGSDRRGLIRSAGLRQERPR